ncbi:MULTISPECIES: gliding motility lipoprotein GldH [Sphingobacteriaceae]|uniref:Gliding motility-associated lipoprotein GldH n=1 Tax=Sphingobacterium sp. (strain 21) TaxID=743722 RepID=F4CAR2_SPHS2
MVKNPKIRNLICLVAMMSCMLSCNHGALVDEFRPVPNQAWNYAFTPAFKVEVKDNTIPYRLKVNVRLTSEYRYANLFVLVHQRSAKHKPSSKRIELQVADKDGRWLGKGIGSLYSYQIAYNTNYHFPDTGTYYFKIEQNMRDSPLKGVSDVGICVLPESVAK